MFHYFTVAGAKENVLMHLPTYPVAGPTLPVESAVEMTWMAMGQSLRMTWVNIMKTCVDAIQPLLNVSIHLFKMAW